MPWRGKGLVDFKVLMGAEEGYEEAISQPLSSQRLVPKRMISMIVPDELVGRVVTAIIDTNRTGNRGWQDFCNACG
jgi:nitrogen regulatory protein PII 2